MNSTELLDLAEICTVLAESNKLNKWEAEFVAGLIRSIASGKVLNLTERQRCVLNGMYFDHCLKSSAIRLEKKWGIVPRTRQNSSSR